MGGGIGLPPGIAFTVHHVSGAGLGEHAIASGQTDRRGEALIPPHDCLFIGETYILRVSESSAVRGCEKEFKLGDDDMLVGAVGGIAVETTLPTIDVVVERTSVAVVVSLQGSSSLGPDHWSRLGQLHAPPSVRLRVLHAATRGFVCELATNERGEALIEQGHGLYVNETYTIEVPDSKQVRRKEVDFTAEPLARSP